jgi:hypothetical protein
MKKAEVVNWPFHLPELPPGLGGPLWKNGQQVAHGLLMHPSPPFFPPTSITYQLGGKYSRFRGEFTFLDTAEPGAGAAFFVYADEKEIWHSQVVTAGQPGERFDIPVNGTDALKIVVKGVGEPRGCHAVLLDPILTK